MTTVLATAMGLEMAPVRHVLRAQEFDREILEDWLFPTARQMQLTLSRFEGREKLRKTLRHRIVVVEFYEPSTRTFKSFLAAALHLGADIIPLNGGRIFSSEAKGESLLDSVQFTSGYHVDAIVVRHDRDGAIAEAAPYSSVPIVNAGDGKGQHPSQSVLDLCTIKQEKSQIDGLTVAFIGDLAYSRVVRSDVELLCLYDVDFIFASDERFRLSGDVKAYLRKHGKKFRETDSMEDAMRNSDVVYMTRTQTERIEDEALKAEIPVIQKRFTIGLEQMAWMKPDAILMHPFPRIWEIKREVDKDPRAAYFRQGQNGLYVRMALLKYVIHGPK